MRKIIKLTLITTLIILLCYGISFGQEADVTAAAEKSVWNFIINNFFLVFGAFIIISATFYILKVGMNVMEIQYRNTLKEKGIEIAPARKSIMSDFSMKKIMNYANSFIPMSKESTIDLGHNYDGIRELDNKLPPWWLGLMYGSMIFAVVYIYYYHMSDNDWSSNQEYLAEMQEGKAIKEAYLFKMGNAINENNVELLTDQESLSSGQELYMRNCVACHGVEGQGGVGPNLTDKFWVHGGGIKDVFSTIKYGVPEKGMIAWSNQLRPKNIQELASYISTLVGTDPPNPKAPEGTEYNPESD